MLLSHTMYHQSRMENCYLIHSCQRYWRRIKMQARTAYVTYRSELERLGVKVEGLTDVELENMHELSLEYINSNFSYGFGWEHPIWCNSARAPHQTRDDTDDGDSDSDSGPPDPAHTDSDGEGDSRNRPRLHGTGSEDRNLC